MFVGGINERTGDTKKGADVLEQEKELMKTSQRDKMVQVLQGHEEFDNWKRDDFLSASWLGFL